jgi:hypothetical protein
LTNSEKPLNWQANELQTLLGEQAGTMSVKPNPYGFLAANLEILEMQLSSLGI